MLLLHLLLACTGPGTYCDGTTSVVYDPLASTTLDAWPDDVFSEDDRDSPTGRRVSILQTPWYAGLPELLQGIAAGVEGLTGFGTQADITFRFTAEMGELPDVAASTTDPRIQLWDVDAKERVPYDARLGPLGRQILLTPVGPLRPGAEHAAIVTSAQLDQQGRCAAPSGTLRALLDRDPPEGLEDRAKALKRALRRTGVDREEVSAMVAFTTHLDHLPYLDAMEEARLSEQAWRPLWQCEQHEGYRACETAFDPVDFRGPDQIVEPGATERQRVPVRVWLPDGMSNAPLLVYGHGLGQWRGDGDEIARLVTPRGVAMVGSDALFHGDHPTAEGTPSPEVFLGIDLDGGIAFDPQQMRASFDQSNLDRRQLLSLIRSQPDLDGDGTPDIDPDRVGYLGLSLGGILGSGLLVGSDDIDAAVLAIAGGNLMTIVRDGEFAATFMPLLANLAGGPEQLQTAFSVLQTAIDPSDPVLYASNVLRDRAVDGDPPHVLLPVATLDEVVPFAAGRALARAYGLPHVHPIAVPVAGIPDAGASQVAGNLDGVTAGYFQYDRITRNGTVRPSEHLMPRSDEFAVQLDRFLESWLATGVPEIVDPYAIVHTPDL